MVYFTSKIPQGDISARGSNVECPQCSNQVTTKIRWYIQGPWVGFAGVPLAGRRSYYHVCPVCSSAIEELTKAQVSALKAG